MKKIPVILYCTENYLKGSLNVIETLNLYHDDLHFFLYTLNFKYESKISNLDTIFIEDDRIENNINFRGIKNDTENTNVYKAIFFKSRVILHSLTELMLDNAIYIDSDIIPTGSIKSLYKYFDFITDYPLIQSGPYEYLIAYDRGNPFTENGFDETKILEYPLMKRHFIDIKNRTGYSNASIVLYNKRCKQFITEYNWLNELGYEMTKTEIELYYPFIDETTINVLLWKYRYNDRLPILQMNIDDLEQVKEYYESNYETKKEIKPFVFVPTKEERKNILFFHGVKGKLSDECFDYQTNMFNTKIDTEENKYYISPNVNFDRMLITSFYDGEDLFYETETHYQQGLEYWFSPNKRLKDTKSLNVKIYDDGKLIFKK
jgi:hypothetical protein